MKPWELIEEQLKAMKAGKDMTVATIVSAEGSTTRTNGKMLVFEDGSICGTVGGGAVERQVIEDAKEILQTGQNAVKIYDYNIPAANKGLSCGGKLTVFLECVRNEQPQLIMVGGGHVGTALMRVARLSGFTVTLLDTRDETQIGEGISLADRFVPLTDFREGVREFHAPKGAFYVVATFGHTADGDALGGVLSHAQDAAYIGMIGSRRKIKALFERLEGEGYSRELLDKVHSPIGLDLGGETPEEIAIAILAELLKVKNYGDDR